MHLAGGSRHSHRQTRLKDIESSPVATDSISRGTRRGFASGAAHAYDLNRVMLIGAEQRLPKTFAVGTDQLSLCHACRFGFVNVTALASSVTVE